MIRTRWALATLLAGYLVACSDDDPKPDLADPTPSVSSTAPTEASTSPTTLPTIGPTAPDEVSEHTAAGAEAFVRYYIEVFNHAQATGDTALLAKLSSEECVACRAYLHGIRATFDGGGHVEGGELSIAPLKELPRDHGADWGGYAKGRSAAQVVTSGDGSAQSHDGSKFALYAYAKWAGSGWQMIYIRTPPA